MATIRYLDPVCVTKCSINVPWKVKPCIQNKCWRTKHIPDPVKPPPPGPRPEPRPAEPQPSAPQPSSPNNRLFSSSLEAGKAAIRSINQRSVSENVEYCGAIVRNHKFQYSYTTPQRGGETRGGKPYCVDGKGLLIPDGAVRVGYYHTHGSTGGEDFSPEDKWWARGAYLLGMTTFLLGTPCGGIKELNIWGQVTVHVSADAKCLEGK